MIYYYVSENWEQLLPWEQLYLLGTWILGLNIPIVGY